MGWLLEIPILVVIASIKAAVTLAPAEEAKY